MIAMTFHIFIRCGVGIAPIVKLPNLKNYHRVIYQTTFFAQCESVDFFTFFTEIMRYIINNILMTQTYLTRSAALKQNFTGIFDSLSRYYQLWRGRGRFFSDSICSSLIC